MADVNITTQLEGLSQVESELRKLVSQLRDAQGQLGGVGKGASEAQKGVAALNGGMGMLNRELSRFVPPSLAPYISMLVTATAGTVAFAGTVALATGALVGLTKNLGDTVEQLDNTATRLGMTTEQVERLQFVASQSGTSFEALSYTVFELQRRMAMAAEGNKQMRKAFDELGMSIFDANGNMISGYDALMQLDKLLAGMEGPEKARKAMEVGGRGMRMALAAMKGDMKEVADAAPVMSEELKKAGEESDKAFDNLSKQFRNLRLIAMDALIPAMNATSGTVADFSNKLDTLAKNKSFETWVRNVALSFAVLADGFHATAGGIVQLGSAITVGVAQLGALARGDVAAAKSYGQAWLVEFKQYLANLGSIQVATREFYAAQDKQRQQDVARDQEYLTKLIAVRKAYANSSIAVQREAVKSLTEAYYKESNAAAPFAGGNAWRNALGTGTGGTGKAAKDALAPLRSMNEELQRSIDTFGMSDIAIKEWNLTQGELSKITGKGAEALRQQNLALLAMLQAKQQAKKLTEDQAEADEHLRKTIAEVNKETADTTKYLEDQASAMEDVANPARVLQRELEYIAWIQQKVGMSAAAVAKAQAEAYAKYNKAMLENTDDTTKGMIEFWRKAAESMQDAMSDFFYDILEGRNESLLDSFIHMLNRMTAEWLAARVNFGLFGGNVEQGQIGGLLGGFAGGGLPISIGGMLPSLPGSDQNILGSFFSLFGFSKGGVMTKFGPMSLPLHSYQGGGIADTPQLVQFAEERPEAFIPLGDDRSIPVTIKEQPFQDRRRRQPALNITLNINTPDYNGFNQSRGQVLAEFQRAVAQFRRYY